MKIAITGGIGSGKTTVGKMLVDQLKGDYCYASVDAIASNVMESLRDRATLGRTNSRVAQMLPIFSKQEISDIFFVNDGFRKEYEAIANPEIEKMLERNMVINNIIVEFPLLFRPDIKERWLKRFDLVIVVTASPQTRMHRALSRDPGMSTGKVRRIMEMQPDPKEMAEEADIVYENNDVSTDEMIEEIEKLADIIRHKGIQTSAEKNASELLEQIKNRPVVKQKLAIVPGSFDPIQKGHLYVIGRALQFVDSVRVVVARNDKKEPFFTLKEKISMIRESILEELGEEAMSKIVVDVLAKEKLLITYATEKGASIIVRGLRSGFDFDYESGINAAQHDLNDAIETVYIMTPSKYTQVSSTLVKALAKYPEAEKALSGYVTKSVLKMLKEKNK